MTGAAEVPHPAWCRVQGCDAARSYTHRSAIARIPTGAGTRLDVFIEGGEAGLLSSVLAIESRTCRCRSCDPRDLIVVDLAEARALYAAIGELLATVDTP